MKVKDIKQTLERKREFFTELQCIELKLRDNKELCKELNDKLGTTNISQTITEARMSFYDNEILKLERMIDNAEIQLT